jgi:HlyD family secretion protein
VLAGQPVRFTVDAHGGREFTGRVSQVRLQPVVAQNVVSYTTMIDVDNLDLALKPGMTATARIETARSDDALLAPAAAVRFRPSAEVLQAMGQPQAAAPAARTRANGTARQRTGGGAAAQSSGRGTIWLLVDGRLERAGVEVGISDGAVVAVAGPRVVEGATVATGVAAATATASAAPATSGSPLVPTPPRRQRR